MTARTALAVTLAVLAPVGARALDKQGSAHGGDVSGASEGFAFSGALLAGAAYFNPSYAARPDNTGHALLRYAAHADVDLVGRRLSIPIDVNFFTDRDKPGFGAVSPSELDVIVGVTSTWPAGPGAVELGARLEMDRPIDTASLVQAYADVRARWLFSLANLVRGLKDALQDGNVTGWATLGWFAWNPTYAARPDNSGLALLRYALHGEVSMFSDLVSIAFDGAFFTDRQAAWLRPTELDFTVDLILRHAPFELHVAFETDQPLDRGGLVQSIGYAYGAWAFDLSGNEPAPVKDREQVPAI